MRKILNKVPLPLKLSLLGFLPVIFIVYVSFMLNDEKKERIVVIERFVAQIRQISVINQLIERLQTERRFAFGHVISGDWKAELVVASKETDESLKSIEEIGGVRYRQIRKYGMFDKVQELRELVNKRQSDPQAIMDLYTGMILRLTVLSYISADNVTYLEQINQPVRGQRIMSQISTYMGIMRAQVYHHLKNKDHQLKDSYRFASDFYYFRSLEKELRDKVSAADWAEYHQVRTNPDFNLTIRTFEKAAEQGQLPAQLDAEDWWKSSAVAIDLVRNQQRRLVNEVESVAESILEKERGNRNFNMLLLLGVLVGLVFILLFFLRNISRALTDLTMYSQDIALGRAGYQSQMYGRDVIGRLWTSIRQIEINNMDLADAANRIGQGDFSVNVVPRSSEDVLGNAVVAMKDDLEQYSADNKRKIWLQTGINRIAERMMRETEIVPFCSSTLDELVTYLGASIGVFYLAENRELEFAAGYAVSADMIFRRKIEFGVTLAGKAAETRQMLHLKEVPGDYFKVGSLTGEAKPSEVIICPVIYNESVEGVIELAGMDKFSDEHRELLHLVLPSVGVSLVAAKGRARQQELLEETQAQAEELQSQHSELENMNTELEAQAQKLQASEEELRVQQEELQQTNTELEERSRMLQERNLEIRKTAEELQQATKYKSEFLANISHELRTPLNSILLLSRLLSENTDRNLSDEQIEYARVIQSSGTGLLTLIDEILDLSKIEAGKMQLEFSGVPLAAVYASLEALFNPVANEKDLKFAIREETDLREIETDQGRLEQILRNLISNAIKFTSRGEVLLIIDRSENDQVLFKVRDTGIGIPEDKQKSVFEAFQQADGSTKRKFGGTGLGLSISRELAKLLGGDITLKSEPGKGSEFTLRLPVARNREAEEKVTEPVSEVIQVGKAEDAGNFVTDVIPESISDDRKQVSKGEKCILIVEDDVNFARALLDFTRRRGYKGIVAVRGDEGIELAEKYRPAGVLLDIRLPVMSGWEVMDALKSKKETRHIPVHIMSSENQRRQSMLRGAISFIDKPVAMEQMEEIFRKLEYVLDKKDKKVLIIEDNARHAKALAYFLETHEISTELKNSVEEGLSTLKKNDTDCVILDMGIPDNKAYQLLDAARSSQEFQDLPIIIFTGKSLSLSEEQKIRKYADTVIVKTAQSYQRLLDEVSIFLHQVEQENTVSRGAPPKLRGMNEVLKDKTVLIADDDVRNVFSLSKALEQYQIRVITAVDGKDALAQLEAHPGTDLVLLDMMMPEMDGYETAKKIRSDKKFKDLPVIAVTAKAMTGDREKCIQAGASDYITKPVDIDQLLSLLRVWLYER